MQRKLVQQGTSTLMVSLPSKWVKHHKLHKGDVVHVDETDAQLLITALEPGNKKSSTTIRLTTNTESAIRTAITNAYRWGYDVITVFFEREEQHTILHEVIKTRLIGFEIIKKGKQQCVIENITEPSPDQFETLLRKIFYNIESLATLTIDRLKGKKPEYNYEEVEERIQKYDNFCRRVIAKRKISLPQAEHMWTFLTLLIHGQRELYHLNKYLDKQNLAMKGKYILLNKLREMLSLLNDAYVFHKMENIEKIHTLQTEDIEEQVYKIIQASGKASVITYRLASALRNFYLASSPLMGLLLASKASK